MRKPFHEFIIDPTGNYYRLQLTRGQWTKVSEKSVIDDPAILTDLFYAWYNPGTRSYYAVRTNERLHRRIMKLTPDDPRQVDHLHHDTLDNRLSELDIVTAYENQNNRRDKSKMRARCRGLWYDQKRGLWRAFPCLKFAEGVFKQYRVGEYETESEAMDALEAWLDNNGYSKTFGKHIKLSIRTIRYLDNIAV